MRIVSLIMIVAMFFCVFTSAGAQEETDFGGLTDDELLSLYQSVRDELLNRGLLCFTQLERNDKGEEVVRLQERLAELGYLDGKITGKYDNETQKAVKAFEKANGLENDAVAGIEDQERLFSDEAIPKGEKPTESPRPEKAEDPELAGYELIDYELYARNPEDYLARKVLLKGRVVQVLGDRKDGFNLRFSVLNNNDIIYVYVSDDPGYNILEGDRLTIYATLASTITYKSTFGVEITIPACMADRIELTK